MSLEDNLNVTQCSFMSLLDFGVEVFKEKNENNGEDSFLYSFTSECGIVGVFDGCGGSGAKRYEKYRNKTGAFMASRTVAGATLDWFNEIVNGTKAVDPVALKEKIKRYLAICREIGEGTTSFKGSMSKEFPTTAAVILMRGDRRGLYASCLWAGDSRCYLLDSEGLKQLTEDNTGSLDALDNLIADGVHTNIISASKDFTLHQKTIAITKPAVLFSATDGCFGYFSTPMEFEYLLLSTLFSSASIEGWEKGISDVLTEVAGDDYSLCGVALGYGSLRHLKKALEKRCSDLYLTYINGIEEKTREQKIELWRSYRKNYAQYLSEG